MINEDTWHEIVTAAKEHRHELILTGPSISKKIARSGIDPALFSLQNLNYLNIHQTDLLEIPEEIGNLINLTTLVLHSNNIKHLPSSIKNLTKLKVLDCSMNLLESLPQELSELPQLTTLNFGSNLLSDLPSQAANTKLALLDLSNNKFEKFPDVCYTELVHLAEIRVNGNKIIEIPSDIHVLGALKLLDLGNNEISGKIFF